MRPAVRMSFDLSDSRIDPSHEKCVHELFEQQVRSAPHSIAIVFENQQFTYAVLNARANQLAHHLRKLGIGPEVLVGICLERSPLMVIGLLGILKAGGAYVPLDPAYPHERLRFMLDDAAAPVLITQQDFLATLPTGNARTICLDDWKSIGGESEEDPHSEAIAENLSYVIYTSGSTGKPKGVAIQHQSVSALVNWAKGVYSKDELAGVLASTSICFDLSAFEIFVTLSLGGSIILAHNALHLAELKTAELVTLINTVPSAISELLRLRAIPKTTKTINLAGELLKSNLVQQIYQLPQIQRVFDLYGPSEDTTYSTFALRLAAGPATIGRPILGTEAYLLDVDLQPVPPGNIGEIYLSGRGLARGYLNRPDLTADRFVPNPFDKVGSNRLYRTGDRARYLPDGNLEYMGRLDHQVKLRGFRIELREIEICLSEHPAIRECIVDIKENEQGEKFLVAYIVGDEILKVEDLRSFLSHSLPDYSIPSRFVLLDRMPVNANGKIDRKSLPEPSVDRPMLLADYVAPGDDVETQLTSLWKELLGIKSVGTTDNFFELGGHSLIAVRLFAEIERKFDVKLPLSILFEAWTISQLAEILRTKAQPSWSSLVAIQPKGSKPPLFCVHACGAHVFIYQPLVAYLGIDQPVYGLQAQGIDGMKTPYTHLEDMARHYVKEIRDFEPHGPYYLTGHTLGGIIAFEIARQLVTQGEDVAFLAMFDTFCPLPLSFGPRVLSHFRHLRQLGLKKYVLAASRALATRLGVNVLDHGSEGHLSPEEQDFADGVSASGDALQRTEWSIYLATHVNYKPPRQRLPCRITYFLARDNRYTSGEVDDRRNWKRAAAEFEVNVIPGRHNTISTEPFVALLAEKFIFGLAKAHERDRRFTKKQNSPFSY